MVRGLTPCLLLPQVFICGPSPHWMLVTSRGALRLHPMTIDGPIESFSPFHNINCPKGFLYFNKQVTDAEKESKAILAKEINVKLCYLLKNWTAKLPYTQYGLDPALVVEGTNSLLLHERPVKLLKAFVQGVFPDGSFRKAF